MSKIFKSIAVFVAAAGTAGAANAADIYQAPPPISSPVYSPAPAHDWNGFYVGLHGGGGWGDSQATFQDGDPSNADFRLSGPYVGGQVGYNWATGSGLVLGVEADISWSGIDGIRQVPNFQTTHDIDWFGTVRGRLGWANGNWMPYITGGWAHARGTRYHLDAFAVTQGATASASHSGWTVGGGIEWAIANNWTLKGEYKYIDLGTANYNYGLGPDLDPAVNLKIHTFEVGLNYTF